MQSVRPNCVTIGLLRVAFILFFFFASHVVADIYLLSLSLSYFTLLKRQRRNPTRRPALAEEGRRFTCDAIITLLGKRKMVGPDSPLRAVSKVISSVDERPNAQENSKKEKQTTVLQNVIFFNS